MLLHVYLRYSPHPNSSVNGACVPTTLLPTNGVHLCAELQISWMTITEFADMQIWF